MKRANKILKIISQLELFYIILVVTAVIIEEEKEELWK
jgi:hypothetical protein